MSRQQRKIIIPKRKWLFPMGSERDYQRFMRSLTAEMRKTVKTELPRLTELVNYSPFHRQDGVSEDIAHIMSVIKVRFKSHLERLQLEAEIRRIAKQTDSFNKQQFMQIMRSALKVDIFQHEPWLQDLTKVWAAENVRLIKSVPDTVSDDIEGIVNRGMSEGASTKNMADQILSRVDIGERRAQLIARDQVGKLNGDITMHRQTQTGIDSYIWSTSKDARVRPDHAEREGVEFRWDDPPDDGHPGKPIYCRCVALPVIDLDKIQFSAMVPPGRR